ncbi:hypothetical protein QUF80_04060 [Desulfococcaceae bacterium HSG8]|nr:hypothetical protein [Desulfococcaceae bacterium HSG8]
MNTQPLECHDNEQIFHYLSEPSDKERLKKVIQLLDEWMADESGYDEETWPELKASLDRTRGNISARRLFNE